MPLPPLLVSVLPQTPVLQARSLQLLEALPHHLEETKVHVREEEEEDLIINPAIYNQLTLITNINNQAQHGSY